MQIFELCKLQVFVTLYKALCQMGSELNAKFQRLAQEYAKVNML